jgi:cell division protein ZapA
MAQVTVIINGQRYQLGCREGEEDRLTALADYVDSKIMEVRNSIGQVGDVRLFLMASLILADELAEARQSLKECQGDGLDQHRLAQRLNEAAARLEDIAEKLPSA